MTTSSPSHRLAVALVVVLAATASVPGAATAQEEDSFLDGVFDGEDDLDWSATAVAVVSGALDRAENAISGVRSDATATSAADDAQQAFNNNASSSQSYVNKRSNASTDADVLALTFVVDDEETTRYLVADVNTTDDYENASMVTSTNRTIDEECTLEGAAARNAAEEFAAFHQQFVTESRDPTSGYLKSLGIEYGGKVDCSFPLRRSAA